MAKVKRTRKYTKRPVEEVPKVSVKDCDTLKPASDLFEQGFNAAQRQIEKKPAQTYVFNFYNQN